MLYIRIYLNWMGNPLLMGRGFYPKNSARHSTACWDPLCINCAPFDVMSALGEWFVSKAFTLYISLLWNSKGLRKLAPLRKLWVYYCIMSQNDMRDTYNNAQTSIQYSQQKVGAFFSNFWWLRAPQRCHFKIFHFELHSHLGSQRLDWWWVIGLNGLLLVMFQRKEHVLHELFTPQSKEREWHVKTC